MSDIHQAAPLLHQLQPGNRNPLTAVGGVVCCCHHPCGGKAPAPRKQAAALYAPERSEMIVSLYDSLNTVLRSLEWLGIQSLRRTADAAASINAEMAAAEAFSACSTRLPRFASCRETPVGLLGRCLVQLCCAPAHLSRCVGSRPPHGVVATFGPSAAPRTPPHTSTAQASHLPGCRAPP